MTEYGHPAHDEAIDTIDAYLFSGEPDAEAVQKLKEMFDRWQRKIKSWEEHHKEFGTWEKELKALKVQHPKVVYKLLNCGYCGSNDEVVKFRTSYICPGCIDDGIENGEIELLRHEDDT